MLVVHLKRVHAVELRMHLWHLLVGMELLHVHVGVCYLHSIFGCGHGQRGPNAHAEAWGMQVSSMLAMVEGICSTRSRSVVTG